MGCNLQGPHLGLLRGPHRGLGRNVGDKQLESPPVMGSGDSEWSCSYLL